MRARQIDRVLDALRKAGELGITQADFFAPTCDGGRPITRLAARVKDLRREGHAIRTAGERGNFAVYVLGEEAKAPTAVPSAPRPPAQGTLIPMSPTSPYAVD